MQVQLFKVATCCFGLLCVPGSKCYLYSTFISMPTAIWRLSNGVYSLVYRL